MSADRPDLAPIRTPREELESFAAHRLAVLRRLGDAAGVLRLEEALRRALELLAGAEADDDPH